MSRPLVFLDFETSILENNRVDEVYGACWIMPDGNEESLPGNHPDFNEVMCRLASRYTLVFHNATFEVMVFEKNLGIHVPDFEDTMLMSYMLDTGRPSITYVGTKVVKVDGGYVFKEAKKNDAHSLGAWGERLRFPKTKMPNSMGWSEEMAAYCMNDVRLTQKLYRKLKPEMDADEQLSYCYETVSLPFTRSIIEIQRNGLCFDREKLEQFISKRQERVEELSKEILEICPLAPGTTKEYTSEKEWTSTPVEGELLFTGIVHKPDSRKDASADATRPYYRYQRWGQFNPSSGKQIAWALTHLYGWEPKEFGDDGIPSTSSDILEQLDYPLAEKLVEYSHEKKLIDAYGYSIIEKMDSEGRVYPSVHFTSTLTGRLSMSNPATQTMPSRGDLGKEYRDCIIAREGYVLVNADKSQFQLRILAYYLHSLVNNSGLFDKLNEGMDVHSATATLCGVERKIAKNLNFGVAFGVAAGKLSKMIGCSKEKAQEYLDILDKTLDVQKLKELIWRQAVKNNCTLYSLYGRRYTYKALASKQRAARGRAERQAFNAAIQGSEFDVMALLTTQAMDIIKKYDGYLAMMVHDEVLFEVREEQAVAFASELTELFSNPCWLPGLLPIKEDAVCGKTWAECK